MKTRNIILFIGFLLLFPIVLKAQQKYEREYRIKSEIIPQSAKEFIDSIVSNSRIKWYEELGLNSVSIEAKFKFNNRKFSVEFDTLGNLQDVEYTIKQREITPIIYNEIIHNLDSLFQKWKFQKIQIHYKGKPSDIITPLDKNGPSKIVAIFYEIVLKGKDNGNTELYELTFNNQGKIEKIQQIIQDKSDHLEY